MARPTQLPEWASSGTNVVEPSGGKKVSGWLVNERPAAQHQNWWQRRVYDWIQYLDGIVPDGALPLKSDELARAEQGAILASSLVDTGTGKQYNAYAVGSSLRIVGVGEDGTIVRSDDWGHTWTPATPGSSYAGDFKDVIWVQSLGLFLACGETGEIQSSPDGATWTRRNTGGGITFTALAWNGTLACAVGNDGSNGRPATSSNGTSWTVNTQAFFFSPVITSNGAGLFVSHEASSANVKTSTNGTVWTTRTLSASVVGYTLGWSVGQGFVLAGGAGEVHFSAAGTTWTSVRNPSGGATFLCLIVGEACALVIPQSNSDKSWVIKSGVSVAGNDFNWLGTASTRCRVLSMGGTSRLVCISVNGAPGKIWVSGGWANV